MYLKILISSFLLQISVSTYIPEGGNETQIRILKGEACSTDEYPFLVLLLSKSGRGWSRLCGASLLSAYWTLTAAHCVYEKRQYAIMPSLSHPERLQNHILYVKKVFTHPKFNLQIFTNDIALLYLTVPITLNAHVGFVTLPNHTVANNDYDSEAPCKEARIMGWGKTEIGIIPAKENLLCATVPMIPTNKCKELYKRLGSMVTSEQICSLSTEGIDACQGDSGGPILCGKTQVGIVSWGIECGKPTNPGVYSRVDVYLKFIKRTMRRHGRSNSSEISFNFNVAVLLILLMMVFNKLI